MRLFRFLIVALFFAPFASFAAPGEFAVAAQLLAAAKNADIQQVQILVNNGANINYVDNTGLSLVCTALMNNDLRAAQILQAYGADASQCDRQIKDYRKRNSPGRTGGLFGGLSTAQGLTLAAAGAAVVIGGLFLLTDVFDPDDDNDTSSSSGNNHGGNSGGGGSSGGTGTAWTVGALPYGPAMPNAASESANYAENLAYYAPSDTSSILYQNFQLMNANQNYLLLMRGYSPLARGYMGQRTLRKSDNTPFALNGAMYGTNIIGGGRPVNVALVTANGINAAENTSLENKFLVWSGLNTNDTLGGASQNTISSKYYNNLFTFESVDNYSATEDVGLLQYFDLSNSGTAINNSLASALDNLLVKIVGGNDAGYYSADFMGFMPNGQMTIYRTGGGNSLVALATPVEAGTYTFAGDTIATGDTVSGMTATVNGNAVTLSSGTSSYNGYIGSDGSLYLDADGDGMIDREFVLAGGVVKLVKMLQASDYMNYSALYDAVVNRATDATTGGRSRVDIVANLDVIEPLHAKSTFTIDDVLEGATSTQEYKDKISTFIISAYSNGTANNQIGADAENFFRSVGNALAIFSTGGSIQDSGAAYADTPQIATFENAAPIAYSNLEHSFMSVVAVGASTEDGTIAANSDGNANKYKLAQWGVTNGNDTTYYKSRICGIAGQGFGSIDPWCFSAVGVTDEMATAAAAGAAGVLRSAFYYMTPQQIFTLMALTADGPYLKRLTSGTQLTSETLVSHLESMYEMPGAYQTKIDLGQMTYLDAFKEVFGYGVINLERATTPGTNLYFYDGTNIVSGSGNAYWRAAMNTGFRSSGALNLGRGAIEVAAYDVLESIDGSMRLPRVWKNTFALDDGGRRGLYMGDVLGDLRVRQVQSNMINMGNISFGLTRSERAYDDNMGGLDSIKLKYTNGNWNLTGDYQHYLTDGESRFTGLSNPILALASNAVTSRAQYNYGNWAFGARAFSGVITDEGLLENEPTISSNYAPMHLGAVSGAQSELGWGNSRFGINTAFGAMHENNTVLGAYGSGLMSIGASNTNYVDIDAYFMPWNTVKLRARATFAHTSPDVESGAIMQMSDFDSNAFAVSADIGNFSFGASMPLAASNGSFGYAYANYDIVDADDGCYDLAISDMGMRSIDLSPRSRELRFNASYRHNFGPFTDGAVGFIYRVHPNNIDEYGNESIFMMKLSHMIGI